MELRYVKNKVVEESHILVIENNKNCFLKGNSESNNTPWYFGIWKSEHWTKIVTISQRGIQIDGTGFSAACTDSAIKKFLAESRKVEIISRETFFKEIEKVKEFLN